MGHNKGNIDVIEQLYSHVPAFTDVFSEDTFYVFALCFVLTTIVVAFILSRFITIKPVD
ncbi:uncharacterized protein LOC113378862 [Ctenocephalides felis]|uniref:uncharacterized protein LOC113378862 n=1 Tax=Ctenocephalides felis TaxID=7515 RepID=UPI000E6E5845|nr:uncharacterized protein LOC113378862 [Ctenocephalides felis]